MQITPIRELRMQNVAPTATTTANNNNDNNDNNDNNNNNNNNMDNHTDTDNTTEWPSSGLLFLSFGELSIPSNKTPTMTSSCFQRY